MLSRFDDYPIHQTPEPVAVLATADRNAYDRYWFNGYADDGSFYFGIGMGLYPNLGILDCGFSIVDPEEQHSFHASRRRPADPTDLNVGPFRIDVIEPMRRMRVVIDDNQTGIACDLTFTARTACIEEGRQTLRARGGKLIMDSTRFAQFGRWQGEIRYGRRSVRVDREHVLGTKDRSWGVRPVGDPDPGGAPLTEIPGVYFLWSPVHWANRCTHLGIFEEPSGHAWHMDGAIVPAYEDPALIPSVEDPAIEYMSRVERKITYVPGTRRAARAETVLVGKDGRRHEISLEPLLCFRMKGIGYMNFDWGHGRWKGDLAVGGESWRNADLDPMGIDNLHVQQVMRARMGDEQGIGVLEQLCIGPHAPSGFEQLFDPAKG